MIERLLTVSSAAASHDLTTLAAVQAELGVTDVAQSAALSRLIRQASGMVAAHTRRVWARETVVETFRLSAAVPHLPLARVPVASITSVVADGATIGATDRELDADAGLLYRLTSDARDLWTEAKIVVTYVGGYLLPGTAGATLPADVERACLLTITAGYEAKGRDPALRSEMVEGIGSRSWLDPRPDQGALPYSAAVLLAPYQRPSAV